MRTCRTQMCQLGQLDVALNGKRGGYSTSGDPPNKAIKKPKKEEINLMPNYPEGMDDHNLEEAHQVSFGVIGHLLIHYLLCLCVVWLFCAL